jgi:hypothetical protein
MSDSVALPQLIFKPIRLILDKRSQDPTFHCMAVLHNYRQTSLKTTSRTGDLPDFDCA